MSRSRKVLSVLAVVGCLTACGAETTPGAGAEQVVTYGAGKNDGAERIAFQLDAKNTRGRLQFGKNAALPADVTINVRISGMPGTVVRDGKGRLLLAEATKNANPSRGRGGGATLSYRFCGASEAIVPFELVEGDLAVVSLKVALGALPTRSACQRYYPVLGTFRATNEAIEAAERFRQQKLSTETSYPKSPAVLALSADPPTLVVTYTDKPISLLDSEAIVEGLAKEQVKASILRLAEEDEVAKPKP